MHWVHGTQLDKIDAAEFIPQNAETADQGELLAEAVLEGCEEGLCLRVPTVAGATQLRLKLHWVDQRVFRVKMAEVPSCASDVPSPEPLR